MIACVPRVSFKLNPQALCEIYSLLSHFSLSVPLLINASLYEYSTLLLTTTTLSVPFLMQYPGIVFDVWFMKVGKS